MISKPLEQLTLGDLERLVEDEVIEDLRLEYKEAFPSHVGEQKYDLHADWSAMANTEGGDILYGVREKEGKPVELVGVEVKDFDHFKQQLLNKLHDGVRPQLPLVRIVEVKLENGKSVIIVRIPKSWSAPHRVVLSGHGHFYARSPSGNYKLDVEGLRAAFLATHAFGERTRQFVAERLIRIKAGLAPVRLLDTGRVILQVIPLSTQSTSHLAPLTKKLLFNVELLQGFTAQPRYNLAGCVSSDGAQNEESAGYIQLFRDGPIEWVGPLLRNTQSGPELHGGSLVHEVQKALQASLQIFRDRDIAGPYAVVLSFMNIGDYRLVSAGSISRYPCGEDDFTLPDVLIDGTEDQTKKVLKPIYDALWNAYGYEECPAGFM